MPPLFVPTLCERMIKEAEFDSPKRLEEGSKIIVEGAGISEVNGVYLYNKNYKSFIKKGKWQAVRSTFHIYNCTNINGCRKWFVSCTLPTKNPGTTEDTYFYFFEITGASVETVPPKTGWKKTGKGRESVPHLVHELDIEQAVRAQAS
jgi:hypothetical protein